MMKEIVEEQPTQEKPIVVNNYPYGYTRTDKRYWVETTKRGQRFVGQTLNPKTKKWNKPKKSTYSQIILVGKNEKDHVTYVCLGMYSLEEAHRFKEKYEQYLDDYQKKELVNIIKMLEVYDKVEWVFKPRMFRHLKTGEITESVPLMQLNDYEEVEETDDGTYVPVNRSEKEEKQKEINRNVNYAAVSNAAKETDEQSAMETFKRGTG